MGLTSRPMPGTIDSRRSPLWRGVSRIGARATVTGMIRLGRYVTNGLCVVAARHGYVVRYQPLFGESSHGFDRSCVDRWLEIERWLPRPPYSLLDIGSQLGYFTVRSALNGGLAIGLERDPDSVRVAEAIRDRSGAKTAVYWNVELTTANTPALPATDVTLCMSVYHHWARERGAEYANEILDVISSKTKILFFETGQPDEPGVPWAASLSFMGPSVPAWIEERLASNGFKVIQQLGCFPTHLSPVPRYLYVASRLQRVAPIVAE